MVVGHTLCHGETPLKRGSKWSLNPLAGNGVGGRRRRRIGMPPEPERRGRCSLSGWCRGRLERRRHVRLPVLSHLRSTGHLLKRKLFGGLLAPLPSRLQDLFGQSLV